VISGRLQGLASAGQPHPEAPRWRAHMLRGASAELVSLLAGAALWEVAGRLFALPWLPPISEVLGRLVELIEQGLIVANLLDSLRAMAIGFTIALVAAFVTAAAMATFPVVRQALGVYVYALFLLPAIAMAPILLAVFGISQEARIAVVITFTLWIMILNFETAFSEVDDSMIEMARSFGASDRQRIFLVVLPASLPLSMATLRLGIARAVEGMINGEQYIALFGLGGLVQRFGGRFDAASVFAIILVVVLVAQILTRVVRIIDARLTGWSD
jgi:NitT/TauT family transport system permease protein